MAFLLYFSWINAQWDIFPPEVEFKEQPFVFHKHFKIESPQGHIGEIIKEKFDLWTHYSYYAHAKDKDLIAEAYIRLLSLGQVFSWASTIDLYNPNGELMGTISGCWMTTAPSKFEFMDSQHTILATAIMDEDLMGFTLFSPQDPHPVAKYTRIQVSEEEENWLLTTYTSNSVPSPFLALFGAFVFDKERFE
jgi:hypothetical protein